MYKKRFRKRVSRKSTISRSRKKSFRGGTKRYLSKRAMSYADGSGPQFLGPLNPTNPKIKKIINNQIAKERHTDVNGGGNVINTIVNFGNSNKKLLKTVKTKGAYTTSQYLTAFSIANTATEGNTQEVNDIAAYVKGQTVIDLITNAYQQNATWQALGPGLTTGGMQAKIFLAYIKSEIEFINLSPAVTFVDVYLFRAKIDQLDFSDSTSAYNLPSNAWTTSLDQEKGLGTVSKLFPGMEPQGEFFRKNFKEVYKLRCCMTGGEVRRLSLYMHLNKWFELAKAITHKGNIAGLTHHLMFVTRGSPCGNLNDPYTTDTEIYYSPIKITGTVNTTFGVGCYVRPSNNAYTSQSGLTATYNANVYTVTDEDGNPQNIGVADTFG